MLGTMKLCAPRVLYLGDGEATGAAAYLLAVAHWAGYAIEHVPSAQRLSVDRWQEDWSLLIISDYPAAQLEESIQLQIPERVRAGMALWMIGGWASYRGLQGFWQSQPLHELLPVKISQADDRVHCDGPAVARRECAHPILQGLPFDARPPSVGGYNRVELREGAELLLSVQDLGLRRVDGQWTLEPAASSPLLAVIERGATRCIAWMTDVAPHWVGGWVDWGEARLRARHPLGREVEVGRDYAEFLRQILDWSVHQRREPSSC